MPTFSRPIYLSVCLLLASLATSPAQTITYSAPLDVTHDKPFVMVMINGKGPFRFVIDTGTGGQAFITPQLAKELELTPVGYVRLNDLSGKGGQRVPLLLLPSLVVAGVEFSQVTAAQHEFNDADGPCQGLLGFPLFRDFLMKIDYPHQRLSLRQGELVPDGEHTVLPFRMPDHVPIVPMRIGNKWVEAQIDSGGTGLSLPEKLAEQVSFASDPTLFSNAQSMSTRFQTKAAKLGTDVHLAGYSFKKPFVEINPAFPMINFGSSALQTFAITFDQKNSLVQLESLQRTIRLTATSTPMRMENSVALNPRDAKLVPVN
jgi:hypothetical protein